MPDISDRDFEAKIGPAAVTGKVEVRGAT